MKTLKVAVIGAGAMGSGIAQVCATKGYRVILQDVNSASLERARATIEKSLGKFVSKEKMSQEDMKLVLDRIEFTFDMEECCKDADIVIEAIFENLELKQNIFKEFVGLCKQDALLCTNTSTIPITEIARSPPYL